MKAGSATVAVFAALTALSSFASAHDTAVSTESDELHHAPIDHLEYEIDADTLNLDVRINERVGGIFTLTRITDLYEGPAKATNAFRFSNASCHVVATETSPGKLHGVWHDLRSGTTIQFDHVDRIGEDMGARGRALRAESPSRYLLTSASQNMECMAVPPARSQDEKKGIERKQEALAKRKKRELPPGLSFHTATTATVAAAYKADSVFYGDGACFPKDNKRHSMAIGFAVDKSFENLFNGNKGAIMAKIEETLADVNAVFEAQFNIQFKIGPVHFYSEKRNQMGAFDNCNRGDKSHVAYRLLEDIVSYSAGLSSGDRRGHWHLLTNCMPGQGVKGIAYVGTAGCHRLNSGLNTGLTSYSEWDYWRILGHEIGHGMNMDHSTENGDVYNTPGIMGYGDYNINGEPAFRAERAAESCALWTYLAETQCKFFTSSDTPPPPEVKPSDQCLKLKYNQAVNHCESLGLTLCSREALEASADTVCGFDDIWVWVKANPCAEDNKERAFKRSAGRQKCKRKRSEKIGVRCCAS